MQMKQFVDFCYNDFPERLQLFGKIFKDNDIELHAFLIGAVDECFAVYCFTYDHWIGIHNDCSAV